MAIEGEIKVLGGAVVVHFANAPAGKYLDRHFISRNERLPDRPLVPSRYPFQTAHLNHGW